MAIKYKNNNKKNLNRIEFKDIEYVIKRIVDVLKEYRNLISAREARLKNIIEINE